MHSSNLIMMAVAILNAHAQCEDTPTLECVNQINDDGFNDQFNQYAFAMTEFKGDLYVATLNVVGFLNIGLFFVGLPLNTNGGEIWRGNDNTDDCNSNWTWTRVVNNGLEDDNNFGVRKFAVANDNYLYGVTGNHALGTDSNPEVWQTDTGDEGDWDIVSPEEFGGDTFGTTSGRGLLAFQDYLYVGLENRISGAQIWRKPLDVISGKLTPTNRNMGWEQVAFNGLDDTGNWWFSDFVEFNSYLYTGTLNLGGLQIWRTMTGNLGDWEKVFDLSSLNPFDWAAMQLYVFAGRLYFGTWNIILGASLWGSFINPLNPAGPPLFAPVFVGGNGDRNNFYVWSLQAFKNRLYVGTFNPFNEFDVFSSDNPAPLTGLPGGTENQWIIETSDAFGNEFHYGARSMTVFNGIKLIIGSATGEDDEATKVFSACCDEGGFDGDVITVNNTFADLEALQAALAVLRDLFEDGLDGLGEGLLNFIQPFIFGLLELLKDSSGHFIPRSSFGWDGSRDSRFSFSFDSFSFDSRESRELGDVFDSRESRELGDVLGDSRESRELGDVLAFANQDKNMGVNDDKYSTTTNDVLIHLDTYQLGQLFGVLILFTVVNAVLCAYGVCRRNKIDNIKRITLGDEVPSNDI